MALPLHIVDGKDGSTRAHVTRDQALATSDIPRADASDLSHAQQTRQRFWSQLLRDPVADATDLNIDGSVTPVEFQTDFLSGETLHVQYLRIEMEGSRLNLNSNEIRRFGDAAASPGLTNGILMTVLQDGTLYQIAKEPLRNIGDYLRGVTESTEYDNYIDAIAPAEDLLLVTLRWPVEQTFPEGTKDRLFVTVQDDLTPIDAFKILAVGWREASK